MNPVKGRGLGGGKAASEMQAEHQTNLDNMPTTTRCALCNWVYEGTAYEGRELAKGHRRVHHPEIKPVRRKRQSLQRWTNKQEDFREEGLAKAKVVAASLARLEDAS
jgi:hypothetical protein